MTKKIILALTSTLLTLVVAMLVLEACYRYRRPEVVIESYAVEFYSNRGQRISALVGALKLSLNPFTIYSNAPSQQTKEFSINSLGLRNDEGVEHDPRPKIVFLGGSSAFGQATASDRETIPSLLEQSLKSHCVLNAGVVGFQSTQELVYLVNELVDYRPEVVIDYNGWNDLFDPLFATERRANEMGFSNSFFDIQERLARNHQNQSSVSSSFSQFLQTTSNNSLAISRLRQPFKSPPPKQDGACRESETAGVSEARKLRDRSMLGAILDTYVRNVTKMWVISRAYNSAFIVVFQPELGQKSKRTGFEESLMGSFGGICYKEGFPPLYREFLAAAKVRLTSAGVPWVDINESSVLKESAETLFFDPVHTNAIGNGKIAGLIESEVKSLLATRNRASR